MSGRKLKVISKATEPWHNLMPNLVLLFKYELSTCTTDELAGMCQDLIDSGRLMDFHHPIRRTCFDLALGGDALDDIIIPDGYMEMTLDSERVTRLNNTIH